VGAHLPPDEVHSLAPQLGTQPRSSADDAVSGWPWHSRRAAGAPSPASPRALGRAGAHWRSTGAAAAALLLRRPPPLLLRRHSPLPPPPPPRPPGPAAAAPPCPARC
jgi:hypothetical protein